MGDRRVSLRQSGMVFSGSWQASATTMDVIEPATGEALAQIGLVDTAGVRSAAGLARAAQPAWEATSFDTRAAIIRRAAQIAQERFLDIQNWIMRETGATEMKGAFEAAMSIRAVNDAAGMPFQPQGHLLPTEHSLLSYARRRAMGVVGIISPFNFPFFLGIRSIAPALAVGNAVLVKPNPWSAVTGGLLIAEIFEEAGLPADLLHILPGEAAVGEALCEDPDVAMIQFVGSSAVGRKVGEAAGRNLKKVSLEMGGKNSLIILEDADPEAAAGAAAWASFLHQGQICFAAGRTLVHESIADEVARRLVARAEAITVGNPATENVALGPIISARQAAHIQDVVKRSIDAGATLHSGGTCDGLFYRPTVLGGVKPGMPAYDEEVFGPVASIIPFKTDEEAIALANATEYGLSAGIISPSIGRAMAIANRLNVGVIHVNDQTISDEGVNPINGFGASGNGMAVGGVANWDAFSQWQWITVKDAPPPYPLGLAG